MSKILSVEIGNEAVKIVEGYSFVSGKLESVCKCLTVNIPAGSMDEGRIIDMESVVCALRETLSINKIKTKRAVFVIASNAASARRMELYDLDRESEILSMIRLELENLKSSNSSQVIMYKKMQGNIGNKARYMVYSLPENVYSQYKRLADALRLKLIAMDIYSNFLRIMSKEGTEINGNPSADGVNAFVSIEQRSLGFCVINKRVNEFSRVVFLNETTGIAGDDSIGIHDGAALSFEIEKNIRYYYSVEGNSVINKIYIYGPSIDLSLSLGAEAEFIRDVSSPYFGFNVAENILNQHLHGVVSLCAGSEAAGFLSEEFKINKTKKSIGAVLVTVLLFFAFFACSFFRNHFENEVVMKAETARMTKEIKSYEESAEIMQLERLERNIEFLQKYNECGTRVREIASGSIVNDDMLRMIMEAKPDETAVVFISAGEEGIQIRCRSEGLEDVIAYLEKIRVMSFVERVHVPAIDAYEQSLVSYSIVCGLKDVNVVK